MTREVLRRCNVVIEEVREACRRDGYRDRESQGDVDGEGKGDDEDEGENLSRCWC